MIRFLRVFLKFSMPKSRINQIFKWVCSFTLQNKQLIGFFLFQTLESADLQCDSFLPVLYVPVRPIGCPVLR